MITIYQQLASASESKYLKLQKKHKLYSYSRLFIAIMACFFGYKIFTEFNILYLFVFLLLVGLFFYIIKNHEKIIKKKAFTKNLKKVNTDEVEYLLNTIKPCHDGNTYIDQSHLFSYDLDVFGNDSLYHHINRTRTYMGARNLANTLTTPKASKTSILEQQALIKELTEKLEWRQNFMALTALCNDDKERHDELITWSKNQQRISFKRLRLISYLLPITLLLSICGYYIFNINQIYPLLFLIPITNISVAFLQLKNINKNIVKGDRIYKTLETYASLFSAIEKETFHSKELKEIQQQLTHKEILSSTAISKLSKLLSELHGMANILGAFVMNGTVLYHIHVYIKLLKWKINYSKQLPTWLHVIGEIECKISLANFACNNPDFTYTKFNDEYKYDFKNLGHPLIHSKERVCNNVFVENGTIMLLTGSNMSGKSTFLRTLGVNLILAQIGVPICASNATIHPSTVLTSMRQVDSLSTGASYFYAEVKRLKQLISILKETKSFVLLDEILRGTNSDDKKSGTIGVLKKIIALKSQGVIATHDIEVCKLSSEYPSRLKNYSFEGKIKNDSLHFDYKLREGICKSRTATYLMEKMAII